MERQLARAFKRTDGSFRMLKM